MSIKTIRINNLTSFINFTNADALKKYNLIFGTNGSGKSTLVKLLEIIDSSKDNTENLKIFLKQHLSKEASNGIINVEIDGTDSSISCIYNNVNNIVDIKRNGKIVLKVFNEDYTQRNIGDIININLRDNGLVVGEKNKELDDLNRIAQSAVKKYNEILENAAGIISNTVATFREVASSTLNTDEIISVENLLKKSCEYEEDEALIKQRQGLGYTKPEQLSSKLEEYLLSFSVKSETIETSCQECVDPPKIDNEMSVLLKKYTDFFIEGSKMYDEENSSTCPYCRRPWQNSLEVVNSYKSYINSTYTAKRKIINDYISKLDEYKKTIIGLIPRVAKLYETVKIEAEKYSVSTDTWCKLTFNSTEYDIIIKLLREKYESMDKAITIKAHIDALIMSHLAVIKANNAIIENIRIAIDSITAARKRINAQLPYHYMKKAWNLNSKIRNAADMAQNEMREANAKIKEIIEKQPPQNATQKIMNDLLIYMGLTEYYLNDENKICIRIDKIYDISTEGRRISTAQRKILSLCYFFAEVLSEHDDIKELKDIVLIFDDPVDSADYIYFHTITSVIERAERILSRIIGIKGIKFGQFIVLTHNALLYERLNACKWAEWKQTIEKVESISTLSEGFNNTNNYLEYIKEIVRFIKCEKPDKRRMLLIGNIIRRVLEIIASFDNLGSNSFEDILDGMGNTKLAILANHLSHESFTKVMNPFTDVTELKTACVELIRVIKERHPYQYDTIIRKYGIDEIVSKNNESPSPSMAQAIIGEGPKRNCHTTRCISSAPRSRSSLRCSGFGALRRAPPPHCARPANPRVLGFALMGSRNVRCSHRYVTLGAKTVATEM